MMVLSLALTSCRFTNHTFIDFAADIDSLPPDVFHVLFQNETDLSQGYPANCYIMGGEQVMDYAARETQAEADAAMAPGRPDETTSIGAATMLQNLISWSKQQKVIEISGTYTSYDQYDQPIRLSGKVIMPADGKFRRYILVSHYTIAADYEAPFYAFSLEGVLAQMGYAMIIPDYIGYGVTCDSIHPYLMMELTAMNVTNMFFAVRGLFEAQGIHPEYDDIYLMGYSQGGATTMAVQRYIEEYIPESTIKIRRVFAGGGPYDVKATYDRFVTSHWAGYPVAVPLVLQGMIRGAQLPITCEEMMSPRMYAGMDEWVNSKRYTTSQINSVIGTHVTDSLLSPISMDRSSRQVAILYQAMTENSIISYSWEPEAPVYMMHSMDDETVPYENANRASYKWANANIQMNFGHYGGHVKTCLRFIYTVKGLLREEQEEEDKLKD